MNLERALKLVREFKEFEDYEKLNTLEEMIIKGITMKKVAETTSKTRYNRALRVLKRSEDKRPVLARVYENEGKQYFTDSFVLFELENAIPELPQLEEGMVFPRVNSILNNAKVNVDEVRFICKDLKQMIRVADKYMDIKLGILNNKEVRVVFDKEHLMDILVVMDYKNNEEVAIKYNPFTLREGYILIPLLFERENDLGILMPMTVNKDNETTRF